jgi:hypothetical protein
MQSVVQSLDGVAASLTSMATDLTRFYSEQSHYFNVTNELCSYMSESASNYGSMATRLRTIIKSQTGVMTYFQQAK